MRPKAPRVGDKWETSVNSCGPRHPEWEISVRDKWETSVNSLMRPKAPRVGDKCGKQVEDKCKLMRPKAPKCEGQVGDKCKINTAQGTQSWRQVQKTSG